MTSVRPGDDMVAFLGRCQEAREARTLGFVLSLSLSFPSWRFVDIGSSLGKTGTGTKTG